MRIKGSYFKNRYRYKCKKKICTLLILFSSLFFAIGYSYLNTSLNITGTNKIENNRWDVHFENIQKVDGSADAVVDASIIDDTVVDFDVNLQTPGDFYSFTVDVVNSGTIDAMLSETLKNGLLIEQEAYVEYIVTYSDGEEILLKDSLPGGEKDTLLVTVKYSDDITAEDLPTEDQNINLVFKAVYIQDDGTSTSRRPPLTLNDILVMQNLENGEMVLDNVSSTYVSSSTGIDFVVAPSDTNGKGVYVKSGTENDTYPIYYYRGDVDNNNVIFANFCWKIVRTTETGGVKLVYNGIPTDGTCNNTGEASQIGNSTFNSDSNYNAYVGYMYGTPNSGEYIEEHLSTRESTSSNIKDVIDEWYNDNMINYTGYLEDTVWCNDRSILNNTGTGVGDTYTSYRASKVATKQVLECANKNDRFTVYEQVDGRVDGNGALTYPVALLTADELTLSGQGSPGYSTSNYLYTGQFWWSLSPVSFSGGNALVFSINSNGYLHYYKVSSSYGVRPSVSLKFDTKIRGNGDGSVNNPFVVR